MMNKDKTQLREMRKEMFEQIEEEFVNSKKPEDRFFYVHPSEDHIVCSHALFWVMTRTLHGKVTKDKIFLMLRMYQEEMMEAYLTEDEYFDDLLHYCNILYEGLVSLIPQIYDVYNNKDVRKLAAIAIVAGGYGGDMPDDLCDDILDDMDFHFNHVKCRLIEQMLPQLNQMVEKEMRDMRG